MSEANKNLIRRFYEEVENQQKLDVADELFAADFKDVYNSAAPFPVIGIDGIKKLAVALHERMGLHIEIKDLIAEGDKVVARIGGHSTHKSPFMGVAPTGKQHATNGVEIFRIANGKIAERWVFIDQVPFFKEIGVLPK